MLACFHDTYWRSQRLCLCFMCSYLKWIIIWKLFAIVYISPSAMLPHIKISLFARKQVCLYRLFCLSWVGYYQNGPLYEASLDKSCFISCFSDTSDWLIFCFWWMFGVRVGFSCGVQRHKLLAYTPKTCPQLGKLITCSVCSLGVNTFVPHLALKYPQHTRAHKSVKV